MCWVFQTVLMRAGSMRDVTCIGKPGGGLLARNWNDTSRVQKYNNKRYG
jgi:hypothetical protein